MASQQVSTTSNKYANGKIYRVVSDLTEKIYIGSTITALSARMAQHRCYYREYLRDGKISDKPTCVDLLIIDPQARIVLIENFPCASKEELYSRERFHIEQNRNICVNIYLPIRTEQERIEYKAKWYQINRDISKQRSANRYAEKKEEINRKAAEIVQCECGGSVTRGTINKHRKTAKHQRLLAKKITMETNQQIDVRDLGQSSAEEPISSDPTQ